MRSTASSSRAITVSARVPPRRHVLIKLGDGATDEREGRRFARRSRRSFSRVKGGEDFAKACARSER